MVDPDTQHVSLFLTLQRDSVPFSPGVTLGEAYEWMTKLIKLGVSLDTEFEEFVADIHIKGISFDSITCGDCLPGHVKNDIVINLHEHKS
jgi:hypothetical protein